MERPDDVLDAAALFHFANDTTRFDILCTLLFNSGLPRHFAMQPDMSDRYISVTFTNQKKQELPLRVSVFKTTF